MNLYLIGYRGSGKSTVAPHVGELNGWPNVDSDDHIEAKAGKTIAEIFADDGEPEFRRLETAAILELSEGGPQVVALGGGAPVALENRKILAERGTVIYLRASVEELWKRIAGDETSENRRPDLTDQGGLAEVRQMLEVRDPIYRACANFTVSTENKTPREIAEAIQQWLERSEN